LEQFSARSFSYDKHKTNEIQSYNFKRRASLSHETMVQYYLSCLLCASNNELLPRLDWQPGIIPTLSIKVPNSWIFQFQYIDDLFLSSSEKNGFSLDGTKLALP
jgi:hypothetical protein